MLRFTTLLVGLLFLCGWTMSHHTPHKNTRTTAEPIPLGVAASSHEALLPPVLMVNLDIPDLTGDPGTTVCVPVSATGLTEVVSVQFSINYDETILSLSNLQSFGLPGMSNGQFNDQTAGEIVLAYTAPNDSINTGITVPAGTVLFEACFSITGAAGSSTSIDITGMPTSIEIADKDFNVLAVTVDNGSVSVNGGGGGGGGPVGDLELSFGSGSGVCNTIVCVDLTADNFVDIQSAQFTISYDAAVLDYSSVQNISLPGLASDGFGDLPNGDLTFSWNGDNPYTSPDGATLFGVCFDLVGGTGDVSSVAVTSDATALEIANSNAQPISPILTNNGQISVASCGSGGGGGGGGGSTDLELSFGSGSGDCNTTVCVDLTAQNFTDILAAQFTISYDATVLDYASVQNITLPGLMSDGFGDLPNGNLTFSWNGDTPYSSPNGTSLYQVCFDLIGGAGDVSSLAVTGNATSIEIADANAQPISPVLTNNGQISIANCGGGGGGGGGTGDLTFTVGTGSGVCNTVVCVPVTATDFTDIISAQFTVSYDPSVLDFDHVEGFNLPGLTVDNFGDIGNGQLTFSWQPDNAISLPNGDQLFEVCFNLIGGAGQTGIIDVTSDATAVEVANSNGQPISPIFANAGSINISSCGNGGGGGNGTFTLNAGTVSGAGGSTVCVPITTENFADIISAQFSLGYDASVLSFANIQNINLPGLSPGDFNTNTAGQIGVSWTVTSQQDLTNGIDLADGTVLFEVCFNLTGSTGQSSPISFTGTPTTIEVADITQQPIQVTTNNGSVTVSSGNGGGGGGNGTFTLNAGTVSGAAGSTVCVPITTENFTDIISAQFSLGYNASVLSFANIQNINLPGLSPGDFNTTTAGQIGVSWTVTSQQDLTNGIDLADGTVLFEVCFNVTGTSGQSSPISFTGAPTTIEVADITQQPIQVSTNNGSVTVSTGGGGGGNTTFTLNAGTVSGTAGSTVCVPVTTENFTDIISAQFSLGYNASVLSFANIQNINLPGLSAGDFNTTTAGQIGVSWTVTSQQDLTNGIDLADGTVLFEVCFNVTGTSGQSSPITFTGTPTTIEVADVTQQPIQVATNDGSVTVITGGGGGNNPFTLNAGMVSGLNGTTVCVPITTENFENIISAQFSLGYNASILSFSNIQNINLPGLSPSDFNTNVAGQIGLSWSVSSQQDLTNGIDLPDGTVLFEACFVINGTAGQVSPISFTGVPTSIEVADVSQQPIQVITNDGSVTVDMDIVTVPDPVVISIPAFEADSGDGVCFPVVASDFVNVEDFAFSICFDPSVINFTQIINLNIPGVSISDFNNGSGTVSINYNGNTAINIPDGTTIFDICFNVVGAPGTSSAISFCNTPVPIDFTDTNGTNIPTSFSNGQVTATQGCAPLVVTDAQVEDVSCSGDMDGSIDLTVSGGDNTYTYQWNAPGNPTTQDLNNLSPGTYVVTITSCGGAASIIESYTVAPAASVSATLIQPSCNGVNDAVITLSATGGTGSFMYSIDGGANFVSGNVFNGLAPGTYNPQVQESDGCIYTLPILTFGYPAAIDLSLVSTTPATSGSNGAIDIMATGGTGFLMYAWSNGDTTQDLVNVPEGAYTVTVTDENGCAEVATYEVAGQPLTASFNTTGSCAGVNTGSITVVPQGGSQNYTVTISPQNGVTIDGTTISNVAAGTYTVTISDGISTISEMVTVSEFSAPSVNTVNIMPETGSNTANNGSITLTLMGGLSPYTVTWDNTTQTGPSITGLDEGSYTATITDANGCETIAGPYIVTYEPSVLSFASIAITDVDCNGDTNGSITIQVNGGDPVYVYTLTSIPGGSIQSMTSPDNSPVTFDNLAPGMYTISVADDNTQGVSQTITITEPAAIAASTAIEPETDTGNDGTIDLSVNGGTAPYTFVWSNGATTEDLNGVAEGCYSVTITDANGCEFVLTDQCIGLLTLADVEITDAECPGDLSGMIDITVSGGNGLTFMWFNEDNDLVSNEEDLTDVPAGTYTLIITDASGQTSPEYEYTIETTDNLETFIEITSDFNGSPISCNGAMDGALEVEAIGGTGAYSYLWSTGAETREITDLGPGTYTVTVSNLNSASPCFVTATITIDEPAPVVATVIATEDITCAGDGDGTATIEASGGTGAFSYAWSDGQTGPTAMELEAGTYTVTATDANGCTSTATTEIFSGSDLMIDVEVVTDENDATGSVRVTATGGTAPYTFDYTDNPDAGNFLEDLSPGTYSVTVTDANGCSATEEFTVESLSNCLSSRLVITPDGDGLNERFVINCTGQYDNNRLEVYNRWGQLVFEMDDYDNQWRATNRRGDDLADGVYFFVFEYDSLNGSREQLKGHVTVLRE